MSSAALVSLQKYLHPSEKPPYEYFDGVLNHKAMPTKLHRLVQYPAEALAEVTVRVSPTKFPIPDVIAATVLQSPYPTESVLLCAEVPSPEDRLEATLAKCEHHRTLGGGRGGVLKAGALSVHLKKLFAEVREGQ